MSRKNNNQIIDFIVSSVLMDIKHQFASNSLGVSWMFLSPLVQVLIYSLVFSNLMHAHFDSKMGHYGYSVYLLSGLLGWFLFSNIISKSTLVFLDRSEFVKKVSLPIFVWPATLAGVEFLNSMIFFIGIFVLLLVLKENAPFASLAFLGLIWLILITLFAMFAGMAVAVLTVYMRDLREVIPVFLQIHFWLTPIVYPVHILPVPYRYLMDLNPVYPFIRSLQDILCWHKMPDLSSLIECTLWIIVMFYVAYFLFKSTHLAVAEEL